MEGLSNKVKDSANKEESSKETSYSSGFHFLLLLWNYSFGLIYHLVFGYIWELKR